MNWFDDIERMRQELERLTDQLAPTLATIQQIERQVDWSSLGQKLSLASAAAEHSIEPLRRLSESNYYHEVTDAFRRQSTTITSLLSATPPNYSLPLAKLSLATRTLASLAAPFDVETGIQELLDRADKAQTLQGLAPDAANLQTEQEWQNRLVGLPLSPSTVGDGRSTGALVGIPTRIVG